MANSTKTKAGFSEPTDPAPDTVTQADVATVDADVAIPPSTRVLGPLDLDGLPTVDPDAAAVRAANFIAQRAYGPSTQAMIAYIASRAVDTAELNVVILEQLSERILHAKSPQDILTPFDPSGCENYLDQPLEISNCTFLESDYTEGFPWYASLTVHVISSGEDTVITVGGEKVMYQVGGFDMHGAWPQIVKIRRATKPTKAGYYPLDLRPAA